RGGALLGEPAAGVHPDGGAADISAIEREATGTEINSVPVHALRIHTRTGPRLQLLTHLTNEEIDFVADLLRRALNVRPRSGSDAPPPPDDPA
ncbi:MAG: hypothetical protein AAF078_14215, partial [Planctomycetota bacterium]